MMHGYVFRWQLVPKDMQVQIIWKSQKGIGVAEPVDGTAVDEDTTSEETSTN